MAGQEKWQKRKRQRRQQKRSLLQERRNELSFSFSSQKKRSRKGVFSLT